jgi:RNA polymerase sigma factor (sigma-70 family)
MAASVRSSPPPPPEPANDGGGAAPLPALTPVQDALLRLGLPEVSRCAAEIACHYRDRITPDDLVGPGNLGLLIAVRGYEEERCPSFLHYARHFIRGRMLNAIVTEFFVTRARVEHAMERGFSAFSAHQILEGDLFADPEEKLVDDGRQGCDDALAAALVAAVTEAETSSPEDAILLRLSLRKALGTLYSHEAQVIGLVHGQGMNVAEASREIGVHVNTAQRRYTSALRKLRACLLDTDPPPRR